MIRLIDVLWLDRGSSTVPAAFEVEHTTSIYSGIVRLLDLALGAPTSATQGLFLVAPDDPAKNKYGPSSPGPRFNELRISTCVTFPTGLYQQIETRWLALVTV